MNRAAVRIGLHLFVTLVAALLPAVTAVRRPPMDALVPRLVERDELKAAVAVQWGLVDSALVAGPSLGGVLIASAGLSVAYAAAAGTFAGALGVLGALRTVLFLIYLLKGCT